MKTVTIMRGLPGAGKTTYLESFGGLICSADNHRWIDGQYVHDERTKDAHAKCLRDYVEALQCDTEAIAVDNTNTTRAEMAPYYRLAQAYGYTIRIVTIWDEIENCIARNTHNVPPETIHKMAKRWELLNDWGEKVIDMTAQL